MRTTSTLEDDLTNLLKTRAHQLDIPSEEMEDRVVRSELGMEAEPPGVNVPRTIPHSFGFLPGIDLDKLNQLVDELE